MHRMSYWTDIKSCGRAPIGMGAPRQFANPFGVRQSPRMRFKGDVARGGKTDPGADPVDDPGKVGVGERRRRATAEIDASSLFPGEHT